jgi:predicted ATP-grasp superfamily ATP-dependent carboligase
MKILMTGVGGPTPRSFAIALKKYSFYKRFEIIATDINPLSIGLYQTDLFNKGYVVPRCTDVTYWEAIEKIVAEHQIDYAVILPELEVMEWSKKKLEGKLPCPAFLPHPEIARLLVDKARMTDILEPLGLVPSSVEFDRNIEDFSLIFDKLDNNFWVRSTSGTSGLGSLLIDSEASLKNWIQINPGVKTFIASTYLPGRNLACKLLYDNGKLLRAACGERVNYIMAKVSPSGITGNTSFGRLLNEPKLVELASKAMDHLFKHVNIAPQGFFTVDFKEDAKGVPYITEVNVRHVAFTQCFAAGGANFAEDTIRLLDNDPSFDRNFKMYEFTEGLIFLRDVDALPILMKESELLS